MTADKTGRIWIADGALIAIDEDGEETHRLGRFPDYNEIGNVYDFDIDSRGMLYLFDKKIHTVFKLTPRGVRRGVFRPSRSMMPKAPLFRRIMFVDHHDRINMGIGVERFLLHTEYLRFNNGGEEIDRIILPGIVAAQKNADACWATFFSTIHLLDKKGAKRVEIKKGWNGKWIRSIANIYSDQSGRLLCHDYEFGIHLFDSNGKAIYSFTIDKKWPRPDAMCLAGQFIYFCHSKLNLIRVTDLRGKEAAVFPDPAAAPDGFSKPSSIRADPGRNKLYVLNKDRIFAFELLP